MSDKQSTLIKFTSAMILLGVSYFPTIKWMIYRWNYAESYYDHGLLIPVVSLFVVWQRRDVLRKLRFSGKMAGLWIVAVCLLVHIICAALRIYFLSAFSAVFAIYGVILFFFGKDMARNLIFPIFFLLAAVPLPLVIIGNLTVKLKLVAAQAATFMLNKVGFPSVQDGSFIRMPNSYIEVAAPCSGLRSIIALLTLGLLFAYALKTSYWKKAVLLISSAPVAMAANVARIVAVAMANDLYGGKFAMGLFHDITGYMVFVLAFAGLYGVSRVLEPGKVRNGE